MSLRRTLRAVTPKLVRIAVARARRALGDSRLAGARPRFAANLPASPPGDFPYLVAEVTQEIKPGAYLEGKLANIRLSASRLDGVVVAPGETLSFWALVGCPSATAGFALGRSIRGDVVGGEVGGGLCQVSGIAYEVGLRAGLAIVERFPHSRDLYAEADRFTPLGLDATVVWPNKDLRLSNPFTVPVRFRFAIADLSMSASVYAPIPIDPAKVEVERTDRNGWRAVRITRHAANGEPETISEDRYLAPPPSCSAAKPS